MASAVPQPELDAEGYPSETTLRRIRTWDRHDYLGLMEYCRQIWHWPDFWEQHDIYPGRVYFMSTGGWSGNESIIDALAKNRLFWLVAWQESRRGGHYRFELPLENKNAKQGS